MTSTNSDFVLRQMPDEGFSDWVIRVSDMVLSSGLGVVRFAKATKVRPAELLAVTRLASLDIEDLVALGANVPPKTTWLAFAQAESLKIREALKAMENADDNHARESLLRDILEVGGRKDISQAVRELPSATLRHFVAKASSYSAFNEKQAKAFRSLVAAHARGGSFSEAQVTFLRSLLGILADSGAITRDSRDKDQAYCDQILDALGRS